MGKDKTKKRQLVADGAANETQIILTAGSVLSERYNIVKEVGRGGMGIVYEAEDKMLENKKVAIKVLPPELAKSKAAIKRLKKEAIAAMELHHENIVRLHSFDIDGNNAYIVLEFLDGEPLDERLADIENFTYKEACSVLQGAAAGLTAAHEASVIHRDIKPANLMYKTNAAGKQVLRITDFGIAFVVKDSMTRLTGLDSAGTLTYVAPEILKGELANEKTDQYSLAVTIYELMAGDPPFFGAGLSHQIINAKPREITNVPDCVNSALQKALSKDPADRFNSLEDFAQAFLGNAQTAPLSATTATPETAPKSELKAEVKSPVPPPSTEEPALAGDIDTWKVAVVLLLFTGFTYVVFSPKPQTYDPREHSQQATKVATKKPTVFSPTVRTPNLRPVKDQIANALALEKDGKIKEAFRAFYELTKDSDNEQAWKALAEFSSRNENSDYWSTRDGRPYDEAHDWTVKAAEKGIRNAQYWLAFLFRSHTFTNKRDYAKSLYWYRKAAEQGHVNAQAYLGSALEHGEYFKEDKVEAFKWYKKAAEQGNCDAQEALGRCYDFGLGTKKNATEAFKWYMKCADDNRHFALYRIGMAYLNGDGVDKNAKSAAEYLRKSAEQGNVEAMYRLGRAYYLGIRLKKNYYSASQWFIKAGEKGHADAQYTLGQMYFSGMLGDKPVEAVKWFGKAAAQGHEKAKRYLPLAKNLLRKR